MYDYYDEVECLILAPETIKRLSRACVKDLIKPSELLSLLEDIEYSFLLKDELKIRLSHPETGLFYEIVHILQNCGFNSEDQNYDAADNFCELYEKLTQQVGESL
jgi:hypothetical protein